MYTNVSFHVLRTVIQDLDEGEKVKSSSVVDTLTLFYLIRVQALRHSPRGHDVIHDSLAKRFRHLMKLHELPHIVQHVVVFGGGRGHLLDNRGDVTENCGVQES